MGQLPESSKASNDANSIQIVPIADINLKDDTFKSRINLYVEDLKESIKKEGQKIPVILRGNRPYQIVSGFRRIRAIKDLNLGTVKAIIYPELSDVEAYKISMIENIQRQSITPLEIVLTCKRLKDQNMRTLEISEIVGKDPRTIQRYLKVADAPEDVKKALHENRITISQAYEIISKKVKLEDVINKGLSVRGITNVAKGAKNRRKKPIKLKLFKSGNFNLSIRYKKGQVEKEEVIEVLNRVLMHLKKT